jgi:3-hydroxyisobutyrate dehydrogenase-like beta-hydroxyacid dehydrogenase
MSTLQVAYIGMGIMGYPIAGHIANKVSSLNYPPLLAYNRTQARAEDLMKTHPIKIATSLDQVAKSSDIILSCLLNNAVVTETITTLLPKLKPGSVIVEQSTIGSALAQNLANKAKNIGVTLSLI